MMMIDRPSLREAPVEFRVHCARLVLVWFWMSWAADQTADQRRDDAIEGEPACAGEGERAERHAATAVAARL